jgi:hypothetical protein
MKTSFSSIALIVACVSFAFGSSVRADAVYTFDNLTAGSAIAGQDGWTGNATAIVTAGVGSKYLYGSDSSTAQVTRMNDGNWSFTNTASSGTIVMMVDANSSSGANAEFGLKSSSSGTYVKFGFDNWKEPWFLAQSSVPGSGGEYDTAISSVFPNFLPGDWFQVKLEMTGTNSTTADITGTLYARNLTQNETTWTLVKTHINLGAFDASTLDTLYVRLDMAGGSLDNLTVASVPEPSAAALFGMSFVSLLAYAWRKRQSN